MAEAPRQRPHPRASAARPISTATVLVVLALIGVVPALRVPPRDAGPAIVPAAFQPAPTTETRGDTQGDTAPAQEELEEGVMILRSGRIVQGLLVRRDAREVVLRIDGVDAGFPVRDIESLQVLPPVSERYRLMRDAIPPGDTDAMMALAEWLRARGRYQDALNELEPVIELEPFNSQARGLQRWLQAQIKLMQRRVPDDVARAERPDIKPREPRMRVREEAFPTLTPEQINIMRVYEVDLDNPPRMRVDKEVVQELLREHATDPRVPATRAEREALLSAPAVEVLELMFDLRAREDYPRVTVMENPESLERFKRRVHGTGGWLTNACATSRCHGGAHAGRLYLSNTRTNTDATALTNLLILDRFRLEDGTPLIDYERPARSPLLQMALPRNESLYPHPEVPGRGGLGWRPVFRSTSDRAFARAIGWIGSMYTPRLGYPIEYDPPSPPALEPVDPPEDADQDGDPAPDPDGDAGAAAPSQP